MSKTRRQFTESQRLQIIQEAEQFGIQETLRKHNLASSVLLRWRRHYKQGKPITPQARVISSDAAQMRQLQMENERLKRIIAKQALEIEFKDELLKKSP